MDYFIGLDVGVEDTALCVVDVDGTVLLQCEVPTDPQAIAEAVGPYRRTLRRAGHEAGALSPWLQAKLLAIGLPVIYVEALMISPEDGAELARVNGDGTPNLKDTTRALMAQMEEDLGTRLDWVAVDNFDTAHPHTHTLRESISRAAYAGGWKNN